MSTIESGATAPPASLQLAQFRERVTALGSGLSRRQRTALGVVGLLVVAMVLAVSWVGGRTTWAPLYTDLDPQDANVLTKKLTELGIGYQLAAGGSTIEVASDAVYQARVDLADVDLPASGKVGYGILDDQGLTTSEFGQRVGFQRAMEGELARTIEAIDGVTAATVHLAIPRDRVFALDDQKPSASVMVRTSGRSTLATEQVNAIVNLVSSGIEGMTPDEVSVADAHGHVLASPDTGIKASGSAGETADAATTAYQHRVAAAIESMLAATYGADRTRVTVAADMDFDQRTSTRETYTEPVLNPGGGGAMPTDESVKSETYGGGAGATQGQLGVTGAPEGSTSTGGDYSLNERSVKYAVPKIVETVDQAPGKVNRMSVAVLVDDRALKAEGVAELQQVVAAAAGIRPERGDTVVVSRQRFDDSATVTMRKELGKSATSAERSAWPVNPLLLFGVLGALLLGGLVVVMLLLRRRRGELRELEALALESENSVFADAVRRGDMTSALPVLAEDGSVDLRDPSPADALSLPRPGTEGRREERRAVIGQLIDNQPDEVAHLLRGWLGDRRAVKR